MRHQETRPLYLKRLESFAARLERERLGGSAPLKASLRWSKEPVPFAAKESLAARDLAEGDIWGAAWDSAWIHLDGRVPETWQGRLVYAQLDFSGEGLVFDADGRALQGITNGSVFSPQGSRDLVRLLPAAAGGEAVELWVEAAANGLFGVGRPEDPALDAPDLHGSYQAKALAFRLRCGDAAVEAFHYDFQVLLSLAKGLPETSPRRAKLLHSLNAALVTYADRAANATAARAVLAGAYAKRANASDLAVTAVGHAHIDTGWLWPVRETIRKCARTFANQLDLIDRYPGYVFGASAPQHYAFIKEHYPDLYRRVKAAVTKGSWELQGGMWVEADANLACGEAMVRQLLYGKNFFRDEFGVDVDNLWLPDVFGYSAALPQLLRKAGIKYFLTQKLCWNQFTAFPFQTFVWRGLDGSEVIAHFPPEDTYNSLAFPETYVAAQGRFKEKDILDEFVSLYGIGDGGGGPREDMVERIRRLGDLEGSPKVRFGKAAEFFARLEAKRADLALWEGELYFELHRGTLTTQAKIKYLNRRCEQVLRRTEQLAALLPRAAYPLAELDRLWKTLLLNQFHDILPGSSIHAVYETAEKELAAVLDGCAQLERSAAERLCFADAGCLTLFNCLSTPWRGLVALPEDWTTACDDDGICFPGEIVDGHPHILITVPAHAFLIIRRAPGGARPAANRTENPTSPGGCIVLENVLVRYELDSDARLLRCYDKELDLEFIPAGQAGNELKLYIDRPNNWDAWDIDSYYREEPAGQARATAAPRIEFGATFSRAVFSLSVGEASTIKQTVTLLAGGKRLDFVAEADWRERHRLLRTEFAADLRNARCRYEVQFGYVERSAPANTAADYAKFETCAHRWLDCSNPERGIALLNDGKYGHSARDGHMGISLLRSTTNPDPIADRGPQRFAYAYLGHSRDLPDSDVQAEAAAFNLEPARFEGLRPLDSYPIRLSGTGVSLETIKQAQADDRLILRLAETRGAAGRTRLEFSGGLVAAEECDLLEWSATTPLAILSEGAIDALELDFSPFEIKTLRVTRR